MLPLVSPLTKIITGCSAESHRRRGKGGVGLYMSSSTEHIVTEVAEPLWDLLFIK